MTVKPTEQRRSEGPAAIKSNVQFLFATTTQRCKSRVLYMVQKAFTSLPISHVGPIAEDALVTGNQSS